MVEVWLSYGRAEMPVELPDPIDLRISPRVAIPRGEREKLVGEIRRALSSVEEPIVWIDDTLSPSEREVVRSLLKSSGVEFCEDPYSFNVFVSITRQGSLIGWRGTAPYFYIKENFERIRAVVAEGVEVEPSIDEIARAFPSDLMGISLVMAEGDALAGVFWGTGPRHWISSVTAYRERWRVGISISPLTIASLGGYPFDTSVVNALDAVGKLLRLGGIDVLVVVGPSESEERRLPRGPEDITGYHDLVFYKFSRLVRSFRGSIFFVGRVPEGFAEAFGIERAADVEEVLGRLSARRKRMISVIEDLVNAYLGG